MTGIPPQHHRPGSSGRSGSSSREPESIDKKKEQKEFKLPKKGVEEGKQEELLGGQLRQQETLTAAQKGQVEAAAIKETAQVSQMSQVTELIKTMVQEMRIGSVEGKEFVSIDLKQGMAVPEAFSGANLSISYTENGLNIRFENFSTPQKEQEALQLVEQNKMQLAELMRTLQTKNVQLSQLNIGEKTIALPKVEAPSPLEFPSQAESTESRREQRGREEGEERHPSE